MLRRRRGVGDGRCAHLCACSCGTGIVPSGASVLLFLIENAYGLKPFQILGAPGWVSSAGFDIEAKAEGNPGREQMQLMMRALLEDRFKLKAHRETRELPVYKLDVAKSGLKLRPPNEGLCVSLDPDAPPPQLGPHPEQLTVCGRATFTIMTPKVWAARYRCTS